MPNPNKTVLQLIPLCGWLVIISLSFAALRPAPTLAHQGGFPLLYVAPDGIDTGECHDPAAPCRTIAYAVNQAILGDEVRVVAGTYQVAEADVELLLSKVIPVRGGYRVESGYALQNAAKNPTYLIGPSPLYRKQLEARGFKLIRDAKAADLTAAVTENTLTATANEPTTFTPCRNGQAGDHLCRGIDLLSRIPLALFSTQPAAANDIWGYVDLDDGREYAIIGLHNGTAVVEVTDPLNPVEVGTIPGPNTVWRDVKVYQFFNSSQSQWDAYAYAVADQVDQGLQIIDLSDLPSSISLAATYTATQRAHNIALSDVDYATGVLNSGATAYAYLLGSEKGTGGFRILDLSDPTAPVETAAPPSAQYVHDATTVVITDSRTSDCFSHNPCELYIDFNIGTVDIWDVTDKASPQMISSTPYAGSGYTHSGWWSQDKMHVFIHDEFDEQIFNHNSRVRTLDISDLTAPFVSGIWDGPTGAIDHNGFARLSHYYLSNYRRGLTILDVADPNNAAQIAFFDTFPQSDSANYSGAWGAYPYLPSGTILVSDIERGLFLFREQGLAISKAGPSLTLIGDPITYTLTVTNNGLFDADNVVVFDTLPAGATRLSGGSLNGNEVSWSLGSLSPGASEQVTLVISPTTTGALVVNQYRVQGEGSITATASIDQPGDDLSTFVAAAIVYFPTILKGG